MRGKQVTERLTMGQVGIYKGKGHRRSLVSPEKEWKQCLTLEGKHEERILMRGKDVNESSRMGHKRSRNGNKALLHVPR